MVEAESSSSNEAHDGIRAHDGKTLKGRIVENKSQSVGNVDHHDGDPEDPRGETNPVTVQDEPDKIQSSRESVGLHRCGSHYLEARRRTHERWPFNSSP